MVGILVRIFPRPGWSRLLGLGLGLGETRGVVARVKHEFNLPSHMNRLRLEDQMPNEPTIIHRAVCWRSVHEYEYLADMKWWGTSQIIALSYARWITLRKEALEQLSVEYYGDVANAETDDVRLSVDQRQLRLEGGGFGVPVQLLSLKQRAKHSNFGKCAKCEEAAVKWKAYRENPNRCLGDSEPLRRELFQHLHDVKLERQRCMDFHQQCARSKFMAFEYDDKCGSNFLYLPAPAGGRFDSKTASAHANCVLGKSSM